MIMTAGFMLLGVLCLALVVDTGRLYLEKRSLQRIADVVALELASIEWCTNGAISGEAVTALNRNIPVSSGVKLKEGFPKCGTVDDSVPRRFTASVSPEDGKAVQVRVSHSVAKSLVAGGYFSSSPNVDLLAEAVAIKGGTPLARLTIRSRVANLNPAGANPVVGAVLSGILGIDNLDLVDWQGIAQTDVNILDLIKTGSLSVGSYDELLAVKSVSLLDLVDASIEVVGSSSTAGLGLSVLKGAATELTLGALDVNLVDLLGLATATPEAAADVSINLFDLINGSILLASPDAAVNVDLPINIPGLANIVIKTKVIEPPRLSAVGNPEEINGGEAVGIGYNPSEDSGAIYVRTAQVRVFASVDIPALSAISNLLALTGLIDGPVLSGVANFLQGQTGLGGLVGSIVGSLICPILFITCPTYNTAAIALLPNARVDISLDVGGGEAYISDHDCSADKELVVPVSTKVANLRVGKLGATAEDAAINAFADKAPPSTVDAIDLLTLGSTWARPSACLLGLLCTGVRFNTNPSCNGSSSCNFNATDKKDGYVKPSTRISLELESSVGENNSEVINFPSIGRTLPNIDDALLDEDYHSVEVENVISSLSSTIAGIGLKIETVSDNSVLGLVANLVGSLQPILVGVIESLLSPILDPIINTLLDQLGLSIGQSEVAGQLTCSGNAGVRLVN